MLDFPKWKVWSIWALLAVLCALAVPSLIPESAAPSWLARAPRINLGLDLAGGSYLLLEADTQDLANTRIESMRDNIQGQMRNGTPRIDIGDISTRDNQISFMVRDPSQVDAARERLLSITGGGAGKHMVYLSGVTDHHVQDADMIEHIVKLVEAKAAEIESTAVAAEPVAAA